jgi:hypothetical protein
VPVASLAFLTSMLPRAPMETPSFRPGDRVVSRSGSRWMLVWAAAAAVVLAASAAVGSAQAVQVGAPYPLSFQQRVLATGVVRSWATDPIDLDKDGDVDVPYIGSQYSGAGQGWLQNRGPRYIPPSTFGASSLSAAGGWTSPVFENVYLANLCVGYTLQAVDLTGDTTADLLVSSTYDGGLWAQSSGAKPLSFSAPQKLTGANRGIQTTAADIDGNGVVDIVDVRPNDHLVYWHESNGAVPTPSFTTRTVVTLNQPYYWTPSSARPCDLVSLPVPLDGLSPTSIFLPALMSATCLTLGLQCHCTFLRFNRRTTMAGSTSWLQGATLVLSGGWSPTTPPQ